MIPSVPIDDAMVLQRGPGTLGAPLGEKLLMLSVEQGSYFELSPVTRRIWELLETPRTLADLIECLTGEYDVDPETCRAEVRSVIEHLVGENLVGVA
ncbi:PqqD family peptide modification chaperone [Sphingomonas sp. QA11]|uniref:PqqD family peptide modification chaperone n=1 Tax=Sphingomonas sp. QA11 TaxID=2950605 RepID=UPI00234B5A7D|nr:PqqD family peptide modification chaperone [Sphingomonas sp. QA11]WCM28921.1 PqqD family peptide modification chaperone [Sphingomonas sp. QA11]